MKNIAQRIVIAVVAVAATQVAMAESWRINNDASKGAHFASINEAMDTTAVVDGDTLYLDPGCVLSDAQTITKAVTVIGTGWGYSDKPYSPAVLSGALYINSEAKILGVKVNGDVYPQCSNVVIESCQLLRIKTTKNIMAQNVSIIACHISGSRNESAIDGQGKNSVNTQYWKILNNYISADGNCYGIVDMYQPEIRNNYINMGHTDYFGSASHGRCLQSINSGNIVYNILKSSNKNNMIYDVTDSYLVYNCMSASDSYSGNVCMGTNDMSQVLVGDHFELYENSKAANIDGMGNDAGVYGGLYQYIPYGLPEHIPYFTEAVIPTRPTDGKVKVTLKIENQNR